MPAVEIVRSTSWDVFVAVETSRSTTWNVLTQIAAARPTTWNVDSCSEETVDLSPGCEPCSSEDILTFKRVNVDYLVEGGTRISWELNPHFVDPIPYTFQVQFSHGGTPTADDWTNVGAPVVNDTFIIDTFKRLFGKTATIHYRVILTTSRGTYVSAPVNAFGVLNKRDWVLAREIVRKELLRHRKFNSIQGFLLKARRYGTPCTCLDPLNGEIIDTSCPDCGGTGFRGTGYYAPIPLQFADVTPNETRELREIENRGTLRQIVIRGRFIGCTPIYADDAWINAGSDERYYLETIKELAIWKGVPLIYEVEMRQAAFTDAIYTVPIHS